MRLSKVFGNTLVITLILALVASSLITYAVLINYGIVIRSRVTVEEPIRVYKVQGLPTTMTPDSEGTMKFIVTNNGDKNYLMNVSVILPWSWDKLSDGRGFDVLTLTVNGEDRTWDLLDDGVAHFVIQPGESVTVTLEVKACADIPAGSYDVTVNIARSVVLDDPPKFIHLSWAVNDVYHTITIMWWTRYDVSGNTVVYDTVHRDSVSDYRYKATATVHRVCAYGKCFPGYWHEVTLKNLQPGTTYYFRVGGPGGWSRELKFRTLSPNQPVKIVFAGDSRRPWGDVAPGEEIKYHPTTISNFPYSRIWVSKAVAKEDPDAVVFVGDMVEKGNDWSEWVQWFEDVTNNLITSDGRVIPIIAVIGNHEMGAWPNVESTYEWFKGLFANPSNELWFALDFPNVHLVALATTGGCVGTWWGPMVKEATEELSFLNSTLATTHARWKVVAFHVPYYDCYTSGTGYPSEVLLKYWAPIIEKYHTDFVFNGHVHNYMRSWPIRTVKIEEVPVNKPWTKVGYKYVYELEHSSNEGTTYVVVGTWGAPTDPYVKGGACAIRPFMASAYARPMYVVVTFNSTNAVYVAKDTAGHILDKAVFPYVVQNFTTPDYNMRS